MWAGRSPEGIYQGNEWLDPHALKIDPRMQWEEQE